MTNARHVKFHAHSLYNNYLIPFSAFALSRQIFSTNVFKCGSIELDSNERNQSGTETNLFLVASLIHPIVELVSKN